jgi:hypothetical protein
MPNQYTRPAPLADRFWPKVDKTTSLHGCWLWTSATVRGYGEFSVPGGKVVYAHRLAWELTHGPIPDGLLVCHDCDTPLCVNPAHLFLGTYADNSRDMVTKGRQYRPFLLTPEQRQALCDRFAAGGIGMVEVAREFGISLRTAYRVWANRA